MKFLFIGGPAHGRVMDLQHLNNIRVPRPLAQMKFSVDPDPTFMMHDPWQEYRPERLYNWNTKTQKIVYIPIDISLDKALEFLQDYLLAEFIERDE